MCLQGLDGGSQARPPAVVLDLAQGAHEGAATMTFRIAASVELAQWRGDSALVAFCDEGSELAMPAHVFPTTHEHIADTQKG